MNLQTKFANLLSKIAISKGAGFKILFCAEIITPIDGLQLGVCLGLGTLNLFWFYKEPIAAPLLAVAKHVNFGKCKHQLLRTVVKKLIYDMIAICMSVRRF